MLDEGFFEKVLRSGLNDDTITNVTITSKRPAVGKGENFLSELSRFRLGYFTRTKEGSETFIEREIQLILKHEPIEKGPGLKLIKDQNIFNTEFKVFTEIIPKIENIVRQKIVPKIFHGSKNPDLIVLEDLAPLGYKTKDRRYGLSMDHVLMVLDRIAKFHAGSVYYCERDPDLIKSFTAGIMSEHTPENMFRVIEQTLIMVCTEIRRWPDLKYSRIAEKLTALVERFAEESVKATRYDETEFCVLNHGDCWINNIMFREDKDGKPLDVMLIDFQMSVYSSPVIDLVYFLSVCPERDLKCDKDNFFLEEYVRILTKTMNSLGCKTKPPTIEDIHRAMFKRRMWTVMAAVAFYPRMLAEAAEIESFDQLLGSGETKMKIFENPDATVALKKLLPVLDERGYFD